MELTESTPQGLKPVFLKGDVQLSVVLERFPLSIKTISVALESFPLLVKTLRLQG
jgi:hypothetical protein